jgi:hypothetical protein
MITPMAGPNKPGRVHLGARHVITMRIPVAVREAVDAAAAARGIDRSSYLADVIAAHVGRRDLIRHLDKEVLQLAM